MIKCPICKSDADEIEKGSFDGKVISCRAHKDFKVSDSVLADSTERSQEEWERALHKAKARATPGGRPMISTYDF